VGIERPNGVATAVTSSGNSRDYQFESGTGLI
jgi:hypothetical protein